MDKSKLRLRNHRYVNERDEYLCDSESMTTEYYNRESQYYDAGFTNIRELNNKVDYSKLVRMDLDGNELSSLPNHMNNLRVLSARNNNIKDVPYYPRLKKMILDGNKITTINYKSINLKFISVCDNLIEIFNPDVENLKTLFIDNNKLSQFNTSKYKNLKYLSISGNNIMKLEGSNSVVELTSRNNKLTELTNFVNAILIDVDNNIITNIHNINNIRVLYCSNNMITTLSNMDKCEILFAENNYLKSIDSMKNIISLSIPDNNKYNISIGNMPKCESLDIRNSTVEKLSSNTFPNLIFLNALYKNHVFISPILLSNLSYIVFSLMSMLKYIKDNNEIIKKFTIESSSVNLFVLRQIINEHNHSETYNLKYIFDKKLLPVIDIFKNVQKISKIRNIINKILNESNIDNNNSNNVSSDLLELLTSIVIRSIEIKLIYKLSINNK